MAHAISAPAPTPVSGCRPSVWTGTTAILIYMALATVILHAIVGNRYGFHADELATLDDARHLAWGYPAYPPVTPFFGRIALMLFGTSLVGFRFFASLVHGATIVLAGLMARDFGGRRAAQILAAAASTPFAIGGGALMQYVSFDYFFWVLTAYLIVRLIKTGNPRWWLAVGASIGFGALSKYTMAFFAASIVAGVLATDVRRQLKSKWLWMGVAVAVLIFLPNLLWQAQHQFVSLDMLKHIHARDIENGKTAAFLHDQLANTFFPLVLAGLCFFLFTRQGRPFRIVAWMYLVTLTLFIVAKGRTYYMCPAYPMVWAGGAVWLEGWLAGMRERWRAWVVRGVVWAAISFGVILTIAYYLPIAPVNTRWWARASAMQETYLGEIGWPELVEEIARVRDTLSPEQRAHLGVLTGGYGPAGAVDLWGSRYGLPRAISGINSNWERGYGDPPPRTVIVQGLKWEVANRSFEGCRVAGHLWDRYGITTDEMKWNPEIYVCGPPREGWRAFWSHWRYFG